jgi:hypothetical protein
VTAVVEVAEVAEVVKMEVAEVVKMEVAVLSLECGKQASFRAGRMDIETQPPPSPSSMGANQSPILTDFGFSPFLTPSLTV